jgi:hypothetical protein
VHRSHISLCGGTETNRTAAAQRELVRRGPAVFDPELVKAMSEALDLAWNTMLAAHHVCTAGCLTDETRRKFALAIVDSARSGTRDRARLSESALRCLFPLGLDGVAPSNLHTSSQTRRG